MVWAKKTELARLSLWPLSARHLMERRCQTQSFGIKRDRTEPEDAFELMASDSVFCTSPVPSDLADLAAAGHTHRLFHTIAFAEAPEWIPFLPKPGTYAHPRYGDITITRERNARFVQNFKDGVYQDRLPIDAEHETKLRARLAGSRICAKTRMAQRTPKQSGLTVAGRFSGRSLPLFFARVVRRLGRPGHAHPASRRRDWRRAYHPPVFKAPALRPLFAVRAYG